MNWKVVGTPPQDKKAKIRVPDVIWEMRRLGKTLGAITDFCAGASLVCIEDFAKMSGAGGGGTRIGLAYLVRYWLWKNGIPFMVVAPSTLKKFVVGKASAKGADGKMRGMPKEVIIREVYRMWGHEVDNDNAADAIGLTYLAMTICGDFDPATQEYSAAVRNVQVAVASELRKKYPELRLTA